MKKLLLAIALMAFGFAEDKDMCEMSNEEFRYTFLSTSNDLKEEVKKLTPLKRNQFWVFRLAEYAMLLECRFNKCVYGEVGEECFKYISEEDTAKRLKQNPILRIMD